MSSYHIGDPNQIHPENCMIQVNLKNIDQDIKIPLTKSLVAPHDGSFLFLCLNKCSCMVDPFQNILSFSNIEIVISKIMRCSIRLSPHLIGLLLLISEANRSR